MTPDWCTIRAFVSSESPFVMSVSSRRTALAVLAGAAAAAPLCAAAQAPAAWPSRPMRIVVAYPAGGVSDVVARALAERLAVYLAVPVTIENKAGASGVIGVDAVAKAAPDGTTFGFAAISPVALNPHLGRSPFDPARDLVPVASVMYSPVMLLATPAMAARDFRTVLAAAQARPGAVRWATSGQASLGHVMLDQLKASARLDITHIPYKGGGQQMNDALGGQFEILSTNASPAVAQHIRGGRLVPLAIGAPARMESLPTVPTLAELGYPAANLSSLFGVFAPGRTPPAIVERMNAEIGRALQDPALRQQLLATGNVPTGGSASDFARQIAAESAANARIVRTAHITGD